MTKGPSWFRSLKVTAVVNMSGSLLLGLTVSLNKDSVWTRLLE